MDFVYSEHAGEEEIVIDAELYRYLFKARRSKVGDTVFFRNVMENDDLIFTIAELNFKKKYYEDTIETYLQLDLKKAM